MSGGGGGFTNSQHLGRFSAIRRGLHALLVRVADLTHR
jgi:hypothetical protein